MVCIIPPNVFYSSYLLTDPLTSLTYLKPGCESSLEDTLEEEDHFEFPQSESLHDENHPDHVDDPTSLAFDSLNPMITVPGVDPKHEEDVVITHRKVYVTDKNIGSQAVVHPIKLVIPVDVRHDPSTVIPPPKPIFKMKKFVDYDRKPVVEMVPVTTTVYKPAGISEDQYIDTRKKLISKSKQI